MAKPAMDPVQRAERNERIILARLSGESSESIAKREHLTPTSITNVVKKYYDKKNVELRKMGTAIMEQQLHRLETLHQHLWTLATADPPDMRAAERCESLSVQIRKMLGLDAPVKIDVTSVAKEWIIKDGAETIGGAVPEAPGLIDDGLG